MVRGVTSRCCCFSDGALSRVRQAPQSRSRYSHTDDPAGQKPEEMGGGARAFPLGTLWGPGNGTLGLPPWCDASEEDMTPERARNVTNTWRRCVATHYLLEGPQCSTC